MNSSLEGKNIPMPTRKELRGIASGIAGSFVSRNNDIDGYWAMGILYKVAYKKGNNKFYLNLITGDSSPVYKYSRKIAQHYYRYILNQLENKGLEKHQVNNAKVEIDFNVTAQKRHTNYHWTWGDPFICTVIITDDFGKDRFSIEYGWCEKHNQFKEQRSTRRYAF